MDNPVPRVSIIIPAYNHAPWIAQALTSVFRQSFTDWELIVIDDASADDTWAVIEKTCADVAAYFDAHEGNSPASISNCDFSSNAHESCYADFHRKLKTIRHGQNQGAPATLNEALSLAQGEYIAILNSDDVWHEQRLQRLYEHSTQHDCDFVATAVTLWDKDSRLKNTSEPHWLAWYAKLKADWQQSNDFLRTLLFGNFLITTSNFFFRRELYKRCGGFAELRYVHDYEYAFRLYQSGARMACLWDEALLNYRLHDDNTIRERPLAAQQENMALLLQQLTELTPHLRAARLHALRWQLAEIFRYYGEEWQTEVHLRLVAKEQELFRLIADRDGWVTERDTVIAEQQGVIQQRAEWVAERDGWIAERDALIVRLQSVVDQQQVWIKKRESWLSERDAMISQRDHWVAQRDGWISERDACVAERDQLVARLRAERDELRACRAFRLGNALLYPLRLLSGRLKPAKWRPEHA